MRRGDPCLYDKPVGSGAFKGDQALHETAIVSRCEFTHPGVPAVPNQFLEAGSTLLKELDAPSSVAEYANVQATLESKTKDKDAHKMEGGCLREFTRFLEKEVRAASPHSPRTRLSHESGASVSQHLAILLALCVNHRTRRTSGRTCSVRCSPRVSRCGAARAVSASSRRTLMRHTKKSASRWRPRRRLCLS